MSSHLSLFKKSVFAEDLDFAKLGYTEARDDEDIFDYLRTYVLKNYDKSLDNDILWIIHCMLEDALTQKDDEIKKIQREKSK